MPTSRVVYQNWIAELGLDPNQISKFLQTIETGHESSEDVDCEVRQAIESLAEEEMEFIIRFYFMGQGYNEISNKSGRAIHKLEALHKRAIRKLRSRLQSFVKKRYGIKVKRGRPCLICSSPHRGEIDDIISKRHARDTWRTVIKIIHKRFGVKIKSPQTLIGHQKYH